jgi:prepilin-type N-terminal cleavage/methylation domain-containing protein
MTKNILNIKSRASEAGYSMIELLLATLVGGIVLAGAYASYNIIATQYKKNSSIGEINDFATPTLKIIARDLRMAGFKAVDSEIESTYGRIDNPVTIVDSGNACCDSISVVYDKSIGERVLVTYRVAPKTNDPSRNALYMDVDQFQSAGTWITVHNNSIVADFVEDFQIQTVQTNASGQPSLINLNIVFRSRNKTNNQSNFTKSDYETGNYDFSITDNYLREGFETTILLRNLVD